MDKIEVNQINEEIENVTIDFLRFSVQLLANTNDLNDYFASNNMDVSGITGCTELSGKIKDLNTIIETGTADESSVEILKNQVREEVGLKLKDISFLTTVSTQLLYSFKKNVTEKRTPILKKKQDISYVLEQVKGLEKDVIEESDSRIEGQRKLEPIIKKLNIDIEHDDENIEIWDFNSLLPVLEQKLQEVDDELKRFEGKVGDSKKVDSIIDDIVVSIRSDIANHRNKKSHGQLDENQYDMEIRNRAVALKNHVRKWNMIYFVRDRIDKFDEFCKKTKYLYQKFDKNDEVSITLGGAECRNISELILAMTENWDLGVELLKANQSVFEMIKKESEVLLPTYEILQGIVSAVKKQEQERRIDEITGAKKRRENANKFDFSIFDDYKVWYDACLFKFIYGIKPEYSPICWKGMSQGQESFARKNIFPILNQKQYKTVRSLIINSGLDVMAEYGLLSYYFQRKNEGNAEIHYDIDDIREIEFDILKICKPNSENEDLSLYEFYEKMIDFSRILGVEYEYFVKGQNCRIKEKSELADIVLNLIRTNNINKAYDLITDNSFATLRGWLCSNYREERNSINEYFNWYLNICNYIRDISNNEVNAKAKNYYDMVDESHTEKKPISLLEKKCMVCYKFMKMLLIDGNELRECAGIINAFYCKELSDINLSECVPILNSEVAQVVPYNTFRSSIDLANLPDVSQCSADECAYVWDKNMEIIERISSNTDNDNRDVKTILIRLHRSTQFIIQQIPRKGAYLLNLYYERFKSEYQDRNILISQVASNIYREKENANMLLCPTVVSDFYVDKNSSLSILKTTQSGLLKELNAIKGCKTRANDILNEFDDINKLEWVEPYYVDETSEMIKNDLMKLEDNISTQQKYIDIIKKEILKKYILFGSVGVVVAAILLKILSVIF